MRQPAQLGVGRRRELVTQTVAVRYCPSCACPTLPDGEGWACTLCSGRFVIASTDEAEVIAVEQDPDAPAEAYKVSILITARVSRSRPGIASVAAALLSSTSGTRMGDV